MHDSERKRIWWLASYPKSGNTWLRCFLTAYLYGELDINRLYGTLNDLVDYYHQICSPVPLEQLSYEEIAMLHPAAMLHLAHIQPGPVLCKTHHCNRSFYKCVLLPPCVTRGAIYLVRDPRDIALSWANHKGCEIDQVIEDMEDAGKGIHGPNRMPHVLSDWSAHVLSYLDAAEFPVLLLRYEDLLEDPLHWFSDVVRFLGLEYEQTRVIEAVDKTAFERLQKQEEENGFREKMNGQFFHHGQAGRWEGLLSSEQISRIESFHGEAMRRLGYKLTLSEVA